MQRPQCRVCPGKHYSYEPHVWPKEQVVREAVAKTVPEKPVEVSSAGYDRNVAHRAYMRAYMRKRRAKQKEQP